MRSSVICVGLQVTALTLRLVYGDWLHGRTSQIRLSFVSLHSPLSLVILVEIPVPQVLEHCDQDVV